MSENKGLDCFKCRYFYITWNQNNPRGCKYFGFKTKLMPSIAVLRNSGNSCRAFLEKDKTDESPL